MGGCCWGSRAWGTSGAKGVPGQGTKPAMGAVHSGAAWALLGLSQGSPPSRKVASSSEAMEPPIRIISSAKIDDLDVMCLFLRLDYFKCNY